MIEKDYWSPGYTEWTGRRWEAELQQFCGKAYCDPAFSATDRLSLITDSIYG